MVKLLLIFTMTGCVFGSGIPFEFSLKKNGDFFRSDEDHPGLLSNGIVDIGSVSPDQLYYGTGAGLGMSIQSTGDPVFSHYTREEFPGLPRGANPALYIDESVIVIAGVMDTDRKSVV